MTRTTYKSLTYCLTVVTLLLFSACKEKKLEPATVLFIDPVRHYYPVVQGEILGITYDIENISDNTLFIQEIQTSCGCLIPRDELPIVVLPKKTGHLNLKYNSIKNSGYVRHQVYCYGNFADSSMVQLQFDTNVVPDAEYTHDYEELWHEQVSKSGSLRDLVDGDASQKGYYTDKNGDPRENEIKRVQDAIDDIAI